MRREKSLNAYIAMTWLVSKAVEAVLVDMPGEDAEGGQEDGAAATEDDRQHNVRRHRPPVADICRASSFSRASFPSEMHKEEWDAPGWIKCRLARADAMELAPKEERGRARKKMHAGIWRKGRGEACFVSD